MRTAPILLLLATLAIARADQPAPTGPVARIEVAERGHDAGRVDQGTTVRHIFLIRNLGTAELTVDAKPG